MVGLWQDNYMEELNDCFPSTDWDVFQQDDDMVFTGYIHLCADTVCQKNIHYCPNIPKQQPAQLPN